VPPGDRETGKPLFDLALKVLKEQRIKIREETGADPASLFSSGGIPALSLGIALGRERAERDVIQIESVETGRRFLERFISEMA
jgi:putative aminopeptidase FrvX